MDLNLHGVRPRMSRRHNMENLELMKLTPDKLNGQKWNSDILNKLSQPSLAKNSSKLFLVNHLCGKKYKTGGSSKVLQDTSNTLDTSQTPSQGPQKRLSPDMLGDEAFFDLLSRFQSNRLDDQRCAPPPPPVCGPTVPDEDFFSLIMRSQAKRMDDQRVTLPPAANTTASSN